MEENLGVSVFVQTPQDYFLSSFMSLVIQWRECTSKTWR